MWVIENDQLLGQQTDWDRAAQFGDGLFETMRLRQGRLVAVNRHSARLSRGLAILAIQLDGCIAELIENTCHSLVEASGISDGVFKLVISRGKTPRGYRYPKNIQPSVTGFLSPLQVASETFQNEGVKIQICQTQSAIQAQLAGLKHLNRLDSVLAAGELQDGFQEGLMLNADRHVIEGTMSNVFLETEDGLVTPALTKSGVCGTVREAIMEFCENQNIRCDVSEVTEQDVFSAKSLFMTNRMIGVWPVKQLDEKQYSFGPITQRIMQENRLGSFDE